MFRDYFGKPRARRIFGKLVSPDVVKEVLSMPGLPSQPTESHIEFVLCFVRGETPDEIAKLIGRAVDIAAARSAFVEFLTGNVIVAWFRIEPGSKATLGAGTALVRDLLGQLGQNIKIVHSAGHGWYGMWGGQMQMHFSFLFPEFDRALGLLGQTDFGTAQEFKPATCY